VTARRKLQIALLALGCFHGFVLFAGFFAPYDFSAQNREHPFAPPTRLHFVDAQRKFHLRPFVYGGAGNASDGAGIYPMHFLVRGAPYQIIGFFPARLRLFGVEEPGRVFLIGTDGYGRDQFSRFLYGGQISLLAGLLAAILSVSLGAVIGALAGFYGGWVDEALMRAVEFFLASPWLYLLFAVRAALPLHVAEWQIFILLVSVLGLLGWARPARLVRGIVLSAKERHFVIAARGFGATDTHILLRHVLPQTYGVLLTQVALLIPHYVLAEVTLSFLGLGVGEPVPSWGSLLSQLQQYFILTSYWWMFMPALLLVPLFLAYYAAADAFQEHFQQVAL